MQHPLHSRAQLCFRHQPTDRIRRGKALRLLRQEKQVPFLLRLQRTYRAHDHMPRQRGIGGEFFPHVFAAILQDAQCIQSHAVLQACRLERRLHCRAVTDFLELFIPVGLPEYKA